MAEYLDVLDKQGNLTGESKDRKQIHAEGDWHKGVHIWVINSKGEILIQRRSANKDVYPSKLYVSVAGHISSGEDEAESIKREFIEEIGTEIAEEELEYLFTFSQEVIENNGKFLDNMFYDVYLVEKDIDINDIVIQEDEVSAVMNIHYKKFQEMVRNNDADIVNHPDEYDRLFGIIHDRVVYRDNEKKFHATKKKILFPNRIIKGDTIGVTATSMGISLESYRKRLDNAYENLKNLGYNFIETNNVRTNAKLVSSDAQTRANDFMSLWENENIKWIAQAYGGEFLMEMLPYIDKKIINSCTPKWVTGYSDSSLLNYFLTTNCNIATATTDNIISFGMNTPHISLINMINILEKCNLSIQESFELYEKEKLPKDDRIYTQYNLTDKIEYKHLYNKNSDIITGRLLGGCIDTIIQLLGTPYDNTVNFCEQFDEGIIWYLENCELTLPSLYRALWQMKHSGWFGNINGVIIGRTRSSEKVEDFEYLDVLHKIFDDMNVSVIYDIDTGHVAPQWTMINGSFCKFEYSNGKAKIIQKMV